jgi:hypothetical protein
MTEKTGVRRATDGEGRPRRRVTMSPTAAF